MNWRPISYPKLSGEVVDSINSLLSLDKPVEITDGETAFSIQPSAAPGSQNTCISLHVDVGGSPVGIHLGAATLEAVLMGLISRQAFEALDDDLKLAILDSVLAVFLDALAKRLQTSVILESIIAGAHDRPAAVPVGKAAAAPNRLLLEIRRHADSARFAVQIELGLALPEAVRCLLKDATPGNRRDFSGLPAPVTFELGAASITADDFSSLEPGDVILFDQCHIGERRMRVNVCNRFVHQGEVDGFNLTVRDLRGDSPNTP